MGRDSTLSSDAGHLTGRAVTGGAVTGGVISGGRPRFGSGLFAYELRVLFGRLRTRALLLVLAGVPVLIAVAVKLSAHPPRPGEGPPFLDRLTQNGPVSYTHLRAHETPEHLVCRLL